MTGASLICCCVVVLVGRYRWAPAIRDHASLEELHAAGNRVGDRGAAAIATALRATKAPFKRLLLGENVNVAAAGLHKLHPVDPYSLKPPGLNPRAYKVKNRF